MFLPSTKDILAPRSMLPSHAYSLLLVRACVPMYWMCLLSFTDSVLSHHVPDNMCSHMAL